MRTCTIEGCGDKYRANGLCNVHYLRLYRTGSTDAPPSTLLTDKQKHEIKNMYIDGHGLKRIAKSFNVSEHITREIITGFGVKIRSRSEARQATPSMNTKQAPKPESTIKNCAWPNEN